MNQNEVIYKLTKDLEEACNILNMVREDARMALNGDWNVAEYATDESKEGFECQIVLIERFFDKVNYDYQIIELKEKI